MTDVRCHVGVIAYNYRKMHGVACRTVTLLASLYSQPDLPTGIFKMPNKSILAIFKGIWQ